MAKYTEFHVYWEGPFQIAFDASMNVHRFSSLPAELQEAHGLYAIYGQHAVYGPTALLYIGRTSLSEYRRGFTQRFNEHFNGTEKLRGRFWYHLEQTVYVGTVTDEAGNRITNLDQGLGDIEGLLIASHSPALNRLCLDCPAPTAQNMLVYNYGYRGRLMPICSGRWFSYAEPSEWTDRERT